MDKITIGVLLPSSTIFPIAKQFEQGLKEGLAPLKNDNIEVELAKEFIGGGDIKLTENACNKFFSFDEADIVTGVISNRAATIIAERFKTKQTPLLISDLGGHVPAIGLFNDYLFVNSPHLWRHAWSLGNYGVKAFGKKGMFVGAVYDAGYSFSHLFYEGMLAADPAAEWSFSVPPMPGAGQLTDMSVIFPFLEQYQPDFIMAAFCGAETTLFLNEFIARGWHHKTKVLGLPYLLAPFAPLADDITIYTTQTFTNAPHIAPADAFRYLGLQAGNAIAKVAQSATSKAELRDELAKLQTLFNIAEPVLAAADEVTVVAHTIAADAETFTTKAIAQWPTFGLDPEQLRPLTTETGAGWFNPYLGI